MTAIGPGMRVVCIKEDWKPSVYASSTWGPKIGSKWTVNWMSTRGEFVAIGFAEWHNQEECFAADHFRPLDGDAEIERLRAIVANPVRIGAPKREPAEVEG